VGVGCERGLEGVVAKRMNERYRPGERALGKAHESGLVALRSRAKGCDQTAKVAFADLFDGRRSDGCVLVDPVRGSRHSSARLSWAAR
jgi:hypothetical protein